MKTYTLNCRGKILDLTGRPLLMGIVNVTPDSFSDGGQFLDPARAVDHALALIADGADILDIGGESTRPGAAPVPPDQQLARVLPVIAKLAPQVTVPISIDTTSAAVARSALDAGAAIINDISALAFDPGMAPLAAASGVPVILMHIKGTPSNMQTQPTYLDVVREVKTHLARRADFAELSGIPRAQIVIDPGIGFGKTLEHNLLLLKHLHEFHDLGLPLLVGPSRKAFIGKALGLDQTADRIFGTAAAVACCVQAGTQIIRVHDVKAMSQVARLAWSIRQAQHPPYQPPAPPDPA